MRTILSIFFLLSIHGVPLLRSQTKTFDHITIEQGLSQNTVNDILKDSRGFMWFATNDGLNRYNGYDIEIFRYDVLDSNSVSDNTIYALLEDGEQNIWVGTRAGGLNRYDWSSGRFVHYRHDPDNPHSLGSNFVRCLMEDEEGNLWIGMLRGGGLCTIRHGTDEVRRVDITPPHSAAGDTDRINVYSIYQDRNGLLWIATDYHGLILHDPSRGSFDYYAAEPNQEIWSRNIGKTIYEDREKNLWLCTEGKGLYRFDRVSHTFHKIGDSRASVLKSNIAKDIVQHPDGSYWIATDGGGLHIYRPHQKNMQLLNFDFQNDRGINSNAVYNIYIDDQEIVWVGTFDGGINIYNPRKYRFAHYTQRKGNRQGLSHKSILCFLEESSGKVWIGTDGGGINIFDRTTGTFEHLEHRSDDPGSLSSNVVITMLEDRKGRIWVGTYNGGVSVYDKHTGRFVRHVHRPDDPDGLSRNNVWALLEDRSGTIWVGTLTGGLHRFDKHSKKIVRADGHFRQSGTAINRITNLFEDSKGRIWILGNGVICWDRNTGTFEQHLYDASDSLSLSKNDVRSIYEDKKGRIWIGTEGGGLNLFHENGGYFTNFNIHDGLPNDAIHAILEDNNGSLWLSTNLGLCTFNPETRQVVKYDMHDGLQSNQFSYNAALKSRSGAMFFGGVNGFNMFFPDELSQNPHPPPVHISGLSINNQPVDLNTPGSPLSRHILETDTVILKPEHSVFSITFHALNYTSPEKNQYAYMLEGFQDEWNYVGTSNTATYTNLDPGWYTFRVKASNNDLVWNEEGALLHIKILPPFWKSIWAYMLYVGFFLVILYFFRQYSLDRAKLKHDIHIKELEKQKLDEVNQIKLRFFTNISHELRTPLTLILGPLEKLLRMQTVGKESTWHLQMMKKNADRLLHLINQLMQFRSVEKEKEQLRTEKANIVALCREVFNAFREFAQQHRIDYQFISPTENLVSWFDPDKIEKILYNLLSNAFKFTPDGGKIQLKIEYERPGMLDALTAQERCVHISVRDNGIGISSGRQAKIFDRFYKIRSDSSHLKKRMEHDGAGIGLAYSRELAEMHRGSIQVQSEEGVGSTFTVSLPVGSRIEAVTTHDEKAIRDSQKNALDLYHFLSHDTANTARALAPHNGNGRDGLPKLMVVDDDRDVREFIKRCMESRYLVLEAADGAEAWDIIQKEIPDLVISDVVMPERDGFGLCELIKNNEQTSHIPLILLTAWDSSGQQLKSLEGGADDYIVKPFDTELLEARVSNLVQSRQKLQETYRKRMLTEPSEVQVRSSEEKFLKKAMDIVEKNIGNPDFDVSAFVAEIGMSRSVLYRKLQAVTGQSANEFIRFVRLKRSSQLLRLNAYTISEICYEVGFNDPQYFSKCFSKQFGMTPSEYAQKYTIARDGE